MKAVVFLLTFFLGQSLYCKNEANKNVDTWLIFKGPKGTNYVYWDTQQSILTKSGYSLNDTSFGALTFTLNQMWEKDTKYIAWNDEPAPNPMAPTGQPYNFDYGHSKGVWIWNPNTQEAIILQHSIPLFPQTPNMVDSYNGLYENAWEYGQHLTCISTNLSTLIQLSDLMQLVKPNIYDFKIDDSTPIKLQKLSQGAFDSNPICTFNTFMSSINNITFFAKSKQWNNELYADCIALQTQNSLSVESWIRGDEEGAYCNSTYPVIDIKNVNYGFDEMSFSSWDDHSKWAVGSSIFCAGDINRMTTQYERGGTAFCFNFPSLIIGMNAVITDTDSC